MVAPASEPVVTSAKLLVDNPLTGEVNVTLYVIVVALVGLAPVKVIDETCGAV
jgi:hypothetical protein